jgi:hypothetical protein
MLRFQSTKGQEEAQLEAHNLLLSNSTKLQDEAQSEAQWLMFNSPKLQEEAKPEANSGAQSELRLRSRDDSRYMPQLLVHQNLHRRTWSQRVSFADILTHIGNSRMQNQTSIRTRADATKL